MRNKADKNVYQQMLRFADVTKNLIMKGNIQRAKLCLQKAEELFNNGTSEIKNAISNVYLYSVSSFMEIHHCSISDLFPADLKSEYKKQVNSSGIW